MLSPEVAKRIKELEIYTRRLVSGSHVGDSSSSFKGGGMEFDQIREYQLGDDVRFIDWHSSARMGNLLVKQYIEERNRTILVALDCSGSSYFGSRTRLKYDVMAEIAGILTLVGDYGKDKVGLVMFSDTVECYLPPAKGRNHSRLLLEKMFSFKPRSVSTRIASALEHIAQLKLSNAMVFLVSDFFDQQYEKPLARVAARHDLVAIRVHDHAELNLPDVGFLTVQDQETGSYHTIDTRKKSQAGMRDFLASFHKQTESQFMRYGIAHVDMQPTTSALSDLVRFFRRRMRY